jgi:hypothetical protein
MLALGSASEQRKDKLVEIRDLLLYLAGSVLDPYLHVCEHERRAAAKEAILEDLCRL